MVLHKDKFHSFDALRFLSFTVVFLSHLPFDLFSNSYSTLFKNRGYIGVEFFFVLSGFLITYILLNEKRNGNQINLKNFFIRRILRIWPLFYLMILFAYLSPFIITHLGLTFSEEGYQPNYFYSCLFLENYQTIFKHQFPNVIPLPVFWSLCIEEHFYIIWGVLLYYVNKKRIPFLITTLLFLATFFRYLFLKNDLLFLDLSTNVDFFMFGAIPAYLYSYYKEELLVFLKQRSNKIKSLILSITVLYVLFSGKIRFKNYELIEPILFGCLFSLCLFIFIPKDNSFKIKDNNILSKLGVYTYGLYLTHFIAISLVKKLFIKLNISFDRNFLLFITCSLLITILASYISYTVIEKPFLNLKKYFY